MTTSGRFQCAHCKKEIELHEAVDLATASCPYCEHDRLVAINGPPSPAPPVADPRVAPAAVQTPRPASKQEQAAAAATSIGGWVDAAARALTLKEQIHLLLELRPLPPKQDDFLKYVIRNQSTFRIRAQLNLRSHDLLATPPRDVPPSQIGKSEAASLDPLESVDAYISIHPDDGFRRTRLTRQVLTLALTDVAEIEVQFPVANIILEREGTISNEQGSTVIVNAPITAETLEIGSRRRSSAAKMAELRFKNDRNNESATCGVLTRPPLTSCPPLWVFEDFCAKGTGAGRPARTFLYLSDALQFGRDPIRDTSSPKNRAPVETDAVLALRAFGVGNPRKELFQDFNLGVHRTLGWLVFDSKTADDAASFLIEAKLVEKKAGQDKFARLDSTPIGTVLTPVATEPRHVLDPNSAPVTLLINANTSNPKLLTIEIGPIGAQRIELPHDITSALLLPRWPTLSPTFPGVVIRRQHDWEQDRYVFACGALRFGNADGDALSVAPALVGDADPPTLFALLRTEQPKANTANKRRRVFIHLFGSPSVGDAAPRGVRARLAGRDLDPRMLYELHDGVEIDWMDATGNRLALLRPASPAETKSPPPPAGAPAREA